MLSSAAGVLSLLDEEDQGLKGHAVAQLNALVPTFWHEIADSLPRLEALGEDTRFPQRALASLVTSKVYFHLDRHADALVWALGAGELFDVKEPSEYAATLVAQCVDEYVRAQLAGEPGGAKEGGKPADPRLVHIVEGLFAACLAESRFNDAVGLAVECRRLDIVEAAATRGGAPTLEYCRRIALDEASITPVARHPLQKNSTATATTLQIVLPRHVRRSLLQMLARLFRSATPPDFPALVQCLTAVDDAPAVAGVLSDLLGDSDDSALLAYQLAFDLCSNVPQSFLQGVVGALPAAPAAPAGARQERLRTILAGDLLIDMYLEFLYRNNHTDMLMLNNVKAAIESKNSITHSGTVFSNAIMHAGTTVDTFLRENLEWLSRATNWAKFSATAGLGVIHRGHHRQALQLLAPYLPATPAPGAGAGAGAGGSPYSEGGALLALGLIHANHGAAVTEYLLTALRGAAASEIVLHGCCLGLGLAAMATGNDALCEELKNVMYAAEAGAVAGEAAGLAMGLVLLGTASPRTAEMLAYAHETSHERISRGLVLGIALAMYGRQEEADTMIEQLSQDKDPLLRFGAAYTIAMAYIGTGSNRAVRRLLHVAVSDVSDDVRRAALTALGFVLFRQPRQCPHLVSLLTDSFNPHVRYGATMALGIACAGTALPDAIALLEPMVRDPVDFVRQGAMVALSLVLVQTSRAEDPRVEAIAKIFEAKIADKHEEVVSKLGAIIATGIVNAGGRNVTVSLATASGNTNIRAAVGLLVFSQYWYWFTYVHFLSLAFAPTAVIALNADLKQVPLRFKSNAAPSTFAYPPATKPPEKATTQKGPSAVLSYGRGKTPAPVATTAKKEEPTPMEVAEDKKKPEEKKPEEKKPEEKKPEEKEKEKEKKPEEKKPDEPTFEVLTSPCRVTMRQRKFLTFEVDERYSPVKGTDVFGIIMVKDKGEPVPKPEVMAVDSGTASAPVGQAAGQVQSRPEASRTAAAAQADDAEPQPPAPFDLADT